MCEAEQVEKQIKRMGGYHLTKDVCWIESIGDTKTKGR
jgi:hypothetical protein